MDKGLKNEFLDRWDKYFKGADLPFVFFFSSDEGYAQNLVRRARGHVCMIGQLAPVLKGKTVSFTGETIGCFGGVRYAGFPAPEFPGFKYFLSCGIPGELEGERYKKTPELVERYVKSMPAPQAQGKYIVFKRWDRLGEDDDPQAVIFFATPDVLAGLFTLANFRAQGPQAVIAPFCSGCGSIISYTLAEGAKENPRAIVGMLDVSARPFVKEGILSFAAPMNKFREMVEDMDESFLITSSWKKVSRRIGKARAPAS